MRPSELRGEPSSGTRVMLIPAAFAQSCAARRTASCHACVDAWLPSVSSSELWCPSTSVPVGTKLRVRLWLAQGIPVLGVMRSSNTSTANRVFLFLMYILSFTLIAYVFSSIRHGLICLGAWWLRSFFRSHGESPSVDRSGGPRRSLSPPRLA